jgi:hypothetical protein
MTEFVNGFTSGVVAERQRVLVLLTEQLTALETEIKKDNGFSSDQISNFISITKDYIKMIEGDKND